MLSWLWDALFGEDVDECDDMVGVSMAGLQTTADEMRTLQDTISAAKESLAATEKNARLFYQSIEVLIMETYDVAGDNAETSSDTMELHEMRVALKEQRSTVMAAMLKQKDAVEVRLFRAQVQLRTLEKQKRMIEASARKLDHPSLHTGHVTFPTPVTSEFCVPGEAKK